MTNTSNQILTREHEDQQYLYYDLRNSKKVREAALRRMRAIERQLGWSETPGPNQGLRPGQIVYQQRPDFELEGCDRQQRDADILMVVGWIVAIAGLMLLVVPVATKIAIGATFGGFVVALAGAMVQP